LGDFCYFFGPFFDFLAVFFHPVIFLDFHTLFFVSIINFIPTTR
jgi:hypothetical protein